MESCITRDLKDGLLRLINKQKPYEVLEMFVEELCPVCTESGKSAVAKAQKEGEEEEKRTQYRWGKAIYIDKKGKKSEYASPSALFKTLFPDESPSKTTECEVIAGETKCTPKTMVMTFQGRGFIVRGNGEPPPVLTTDMSGRKRIEIHNEWGNTLKNSGRYFTVYHPEAPQLKKMDKETEKG
jgi:hypothetical protein